MYDEDNLMRFKIQSDNKAIKFDIGLGLLELKGTDVSFRRY